MENRSFCLLLQLPAESQCSFQKEYVSELDAVVDVLDGIEKVTVGFSEFAKVCRELMDSINLPPPDEETLNEMNRVEETIEKSLTKNKLECDEKNRIIMEQYHKEMKWRQILKDMDEENSLL